MPLAVVKSAKKLDPFSLCRRDDNDDDDDDRRYDRSSLHETLGESYLRGLTSFAKYFNT